MNYFIKTIIKGFSLVGQRVVIAAIVFAFGLESLCPVAFAQSNLVLPKPTEMIALTEGFKPLQLVGLKVDSKDPLHFDFIMDRAEESLSQDELKNETARLVRYFLSSMTTPQDDLWVNLSPYEKNRIIPGNFGQMEMGRDLLAQDYLLKQITSSLIYPEGELGKEFWKKIYEKAAKDLGTTNIPINTFNKVWIVPQSADLMETNGAVFITQSHLKVMLEEDYLSTQKHTVGAGFTPAQNRDGVKPSPTVNGLGSQTIRQMIIPVLEKEVNEGKNFARLRQIYNALILATWYKKKMYSSILAANYADKNKVKGVTHDSIVSPEQIYQQYLKAFKKGVYNYIKEDIDPATGSSIPRKYFSGGFWFGGVTPKVNKNPDESLLASFKKKILLPIIVSVAMHLIGPSNTLAQEVLPQRDSNGSSQNWTNAQRVQQLKTIAYDETKLMGERETAAKELGEIALKQIGMVTTHESMNRMAEEAFPIFIDILNSNPSIVLSTPLGSYPAGTIASYYSNPKNKVEPNPTNVAAMFTTMIDIININKEAMTNFINALYSLQPSNPIVIERMAQIMRENKVKLDVSSPDPIVILTSLKKNPVFDGILDFQVGQGSNNLILSIGNQTTLMSKKLNPSSTGSSGYVIAGISTLLAAAGFSFWLWKRSQKKNQKGSGGQTEIPKIQSEENKAILNELSAFVEPQRLKLIQLEERFRGLAALKGEPAVIYKDWYQSAERELQLADLLESELEKVGGEALMLEGLRSAWKSLEREFNTIGLVISMGKFSDKWAQGEELTADQQDERDKWVGQTEIVIGDVKDLIKRLKHDIKKADPEKKERVASMANSLEKAAARVHELSRRMDDNRINEHLRSKGKGQYADAPQLVSAEELMDTIKIVRLTAFETAMLDLSDKFDEEEIGIAAITEDMQDSDLKDPYLKKLESYQKRHEGLVRQVEKLQKQMVPESEKHFEEIVISRMQSNERLLALKKKRIEESRVLTVGYFKRMIQIAIGTAGPYERDERGFSEMLAPRGARPTTMREMLWPSSTEKKKMAEKDKAAFSKDELGGIDLTQEIKMNVKGEGNLKLDQAQLSKLNIDGVSPEILDIKDFNLGLFLQPQP